MQFLCIKQYLNAYLVGKLNSCSDTVRVGNKKRAFENTMESLRGLNMKLNI